MLAEERRAKMKKAAPERTALKDTAKISIFLCTTMGSTEKSTTSKDLGKGGAR